MTPLAKRKMRHLAFLAAALAPLPAFAEDVSVSGHMAEIYAFARIMADVRTADQQCPDLVVDQQRVVAEKDRLHIADVDYFAFRKKAHDLADELEAKLNSEDAIKAWCADVFLRYGPQGTAVAGAVHR